MSQYFLWIVLTAFTGSPIVSAAILVVFWLLVDRVTIGFLPDPIRALRRLQKGWRLQAHLQVAPHDRKARLELAELLVARGKFSRAVEVLKPALEQGEHDAATVYVMAVACLGAGHVKQGEALLDEVAELQPNFRVGEVDLARGRFRLQRKEFATAREALERLVQARKGTVEGRVLLSQALEGVKDDGAAALMRDQAWAEYVAAPRFQRRKERFWAWRARPSRPLVYLTAVGLGVFCFVKFVAPPMQSMARQMNPYSRGMDSRADQPDDE